jgi:hypothetical protein
MVHLHHFLTIKSLKEVTRIKVFFLLLLDKRIIEGSGGGSGSIPLTYVSGSGRGKNMWILWILIRNTEQLILASYST